MRLWDKILQKKELILACLVHATVLIVFLLYLLWANTALVTTHYTVTSAKLARAFDGFRIAQISDLHSAELDPGNHTLLSALYSAKPDIIVFTGDILDAEDASATLHLIKESTQIAPCYYVAGNHEGFLLDTIYPDFEKAMIDMGVTILHDKSAVIERQGASISIAGVDDSRFVEHLQYYGMMPDGYDGLGLEMNPECLKQLITPNRFTILLSHRPDFFAQYAEAGFDLVLSGHIHGGQFRIPLLGGLVSPNKTFFPTYDSGMFSAGNTRMIVSRGIGNSVIPLRINNRPELVVITLQCQ